VELAFLTLLLKDGANRVSGGVAINNKRVLETRLAKNGSGANGVDECLEGSFVFVFPVKFAAFRAESHESIEGGGQHTEISNVHAIKIEEPKERS
jgi:hypothetical protein